jgi:phosphoenolpyruvate synthase/pyruvate phosphate dikinase
MQIIYWFEGLEKLDLAILGGKGLNLVRLRQAELPVPSGFYRAQQFNEQRASTVA